MALQRFDCFSGISFVSEVSKPKVTVWMYCVAVSSGKKQLVAFISYILLGIGSVITFTSAMGLLGSVVEVKCLLVTVNVDQTPTCKMKGSFVCMKTIILSW